MAWYFKKYLVEIQINSDKWKYRDRKSVLKPLIIQPITLIINQMLTTGIFPDKLKIAKVKPIFKKVIYHLLVIIDLSLYCHQYLKYLKKLYMIKHTHIFNKIICFIRVNMDSEKGIQLSMQHSNLLIEFYNI